MVDITECAACGRTIPATEHGCAYCERERAGQPERPYVPMVTRWALWLFVVLCGVGIWSGVLGMLESSRSSAAGLSLLLGALRIALGVAAATSVLLRRPRGVLAPLAFAGAEFVLGVATLTPWLPAGAWHGGIFGVLWSLFFVFFFVRPQTREHLDPSHRDRAAVLELVRDVERRP